MAFLMIARAVRATCISVHFFPLSTKQRENKKFEVLTSSTDPQLWSSQSVQRSLFLLIKCADLRCLLLRLYRLCVCSLIVAVALFVFRQRFDWRCWRLC